MNKKKEIYSLIIGILFILILIVGATYAFFKAQTGTEKEINADVSTGTTDNLTFYTEDEIYMEVSEANLNFKGDDVSDSSYAYARLRANNTTNEAKAKYNVYLLIEENDIEYSGYTKNGEKVSFKTEEAKNSFDLTGYEGIPELVISIKKNGVKYTKEIKRLNKLEDNTYDITEEEGLYVLVENEEIEAKPENTDEWEVTVTYKNLEYDQQLNADKTLTGKIIITTEKLIEEIQTINDLVELSNEVNSGDTKAGKYYVLTRDLDFTDINDYRENSDELKEELTNKDGTGFTPIGSSTTNSFQGNFDGGKHTLSNIYINNTVAEKSLGLFGVINNAKISNLTLTGEIKTSEKANTGIIGGSYGESIIRKCINRANMSSTASGLSTAGIVGETRGTLIQKCDNYGEISGSNNAGGIVGQNNNGNLIIEDSHNYGTIINNVGKNAGGILGRDNSTSNVTTITNSTNEGPVKSTKTSGNIYLGGLVGHAYGTLNIENSKNLKNNEESKLTLDVSGRDWPYIGGIVGIADGATVVMNNVINEQSIEAKNETPNNNDVGGLLGYVRNKGSIEIYNSKNKAGINATSTNGSNNIGGIIGLSYNSTGTNRNIIKIKNVESNAEDKIISNTNNKANNIGGILGYCESAIVEIENVKNKQEIEANNNGTGTINTGGIIGRITGTSNVKINDSQNTGILELIQNGTGETRTGGIVGNVSGTSNININKSSNVGSDITISKNENNTAVHAVGGLIGFVEQNSIALITKSYNTTNVYGGTKYGGIIAYSYNSKTLIDRCYNTGNIETDFIANSLTALGGILGYNSYGGIAYVINSYNTGNLKNTKDDDNVHLSGIVGKIYSNTNIVNTYIANSYNIGNLNNILVNGAYTNGIFENFSYQDIISKGHIYNVYNAGELIGLRKYGIGITNDGDIVNNAYYLQGDGITGSDKENIGEGKTLDEIKELTDTLNSNINSIDLPKLSEDFPDYELTFSSWVPGDNGYPTLDF